MYKLVAIDLDGTLLNSNGVVTQETKETLQELVIKYGKKNIMAVLNTLKSDVDNFKSFKNNQIDDEVNRYTKSIEKLLK